MSYADALIERICKAEKAPSAAIVTSRKPTMAIILKRMDSLAIIAGPSVESSDSLADQDKAGAARSASPARRAGGRETQFQSEPNAKHTGSLRIVLKQLDEALVNRARVQAFQALRSESTALRSAHELPRQWAGELIV